MALSRTISNHTIPTQLNMQPRRSLITFALFAVLLKAARGWIGCKYVLSMDPACIFHRNSTLCLPPPLQPSCAALRLPTHQLEWLAQPRRFRLDKLQPLSALPIMDDFPDFG